MPKAILVNMAGTQVGEVELSEAVFGIEPNQTVVHEVEEPPGQLPAGHPERPDPRRGLRRRH